MMLSHKTGDNRACPWLSLLKLLTWCPIKSLQLIWRSGTCGFHRRMPHPQMSGIDLTSVKSLQLICRSGTRRWNLRVPDLQMSCRDFTTWQGTRILGSVMAARHALLSMIISSKSEDYYKPDITSLFHSLRPGDALYLSLNWITMVWVMVCCLFCTKPLHEPRMAHFQLGSKERTSVNQIFFQQHTYEIIICWMTPILLRPLCVNSLVPGKCGCDLEYIFWNTFWWLILTSISNEIGFRGKSKNFSEDKSTLVQVMAWCYQVTSHKLNTILPSFLTPFGVLGASELMHWLELLYISFVLTHESFFH